MKLERSSGILLHPTSLPGPCGIGTLGREACRFVDFLTAARQTLWQVLPLGPTGYADSPYQCLSAFAGNPLLIDLEALAKAGWLSRRDLAGCMFVSSGPVDYGTVWRNKMPVLRKAFDGFRERAGYVEKARLESFRRHHRAWLGDFALFMALKQAFDLKPWFEWPAPLRDRQPAALRAQARQLDEDVEFHVFLQHVFFTQWMDLKAYANRNYVRIIGDMPLYVAHDSADVWVHRNLFRLDSEGLPVLVSGVPPDYFSEDGQLWGNPVYDWDAMIGSGFDWWVRRVRANLDLCDLLRFDHFRGLCAYWAVPYGEKTARKGEWLPAPGKGLLGTLREKIGRLPMIAEDLGVITPDVVELRDQFGLPGMKILQFAFDSGEENDFLPHSYEPDCVVYTGTHDNDTLRGWYRKARRSDRRHACEYLNASEKNIAWGFISAAWSSVACMAILPLQDLLSLGSRARMNTPGTTNGNWRWRFEARRLTPSLARKLAHLTQLYGR